MVDTLWQDIRFGVRMLIKNRTVTFAAVFALAVGIGANTAIFGVVNSVLLRPLPYKDSDQIMSLWTTAALRGLDRLPLSDAEYVEFRDQSQSLEHVSAYVSGALNLTGIEEPVRVGVTEASYGLFAALGVQPQLGRTFSAEEDLPGREPVVVLSHRLWQRHYGSDPNIVGKSIILNGRSRPVIGVMPAGFKFPNEEIEIWMPLNVDPANVSLTNHFLNSVARLKSGVSVEQANAEVQTIFSRIKQKYPEYYRLEGGAGVKIIPLHEHLVGDIRTALLLIFGAVVFMLVIACANVGNLLMSRSAARRQEIALRSALGASRGRIIRQLLTESVLLSALGGGFGLLLAVWGMNALLAESPLDPLRMNEVGLDGKVLSFTLLISLATGVLFGLLPALQASKPDLNEVLKEGGRGPMQSLRHNRVRTMLVVGEIAISMVLLVGTVLMVRSFALMLNVDPGFNTENILTMRFTLSGAKYPDNQQVATFFQQLRQRVGSLPGVQEAAIINQLPIAADKAEASFEIEGRPLEAESDRESAIADYRMISPNYFKAMDIQITRGRPFTEQDGQQAPAAVIINELLARRFWANDNPLGKRIRLAPGSPWLEIIGVSEEIKNQGLNTTTSQEMFFPHVEKPFGLRGPPRTMTLVVRTSTDPASLTNVVRSEVRALDKDLPAYNIQTMKQVIETSVATLRFTTFVLAVFACIALVLAWVGVYSVMSYSVAQRTHEIGIRKALGAKPRDIYKLIVGQGALLALIGVAVGLVGAFALTRVMSSLLYAISVTDPLTFIGIALLLSAATLLACYLPARRATRVNVMEALRDE